MSVAVIGAGYAGMAAAVELARAGLAPTVFEAGRVPGGRARTVTVDGLALDNGQHILVGAYRETLRLIGMVGVDAGAALARLPLRLDYPGELRLAAPRLPAPWHLLAALLGARGLPWRDRLAAIGFMRRMQAGGFRLAADISVDALLRRERQGPALRLRIWDALCVSALNTPPAGASAQVFLNVLRDTLAGARADSDLLIPRIGLTELFPGPAAAYVAARGGALNTGRAIAGIVATADGYRLPPDERLWRQVVVAVAPHQLRRLAEGVAPLAAALARTRVLDHQPILTAYLQYEAPLRLSAPMLGQAGGMAQWFFDRSALGGPAGLVAAVVSASREARALDPESLGARLDGELRRLAGNAPALRWHRLIMEKRATFACAPGLARPAGGAVGDGLWLAGDYVDSPYPATLEAAVRSGVVCARGILAVAGRDRPAP